MPRSHNHDRTYITPADSQAQIDTSKGIDADKLPVHGQLGTAAYLDQTWLHKSFVYDAPPLVAGGVHAFDVDFPGVNLGDFAFISVSYEQPWQLGLYCSVKAAGVIQVYVQNRDIFNAMDLPSATYNIRVLTLTPTR